MDILIIRFAGLAGDLFVLGWRKRRNHYSINRDADIDEGLFLLLSIQLPTNNEESDRSSALEVDYYGACSIVPFLRPAKVLWIEIHCSEGTHS